MASMETLSKERKISHFDIANTMREKLNTREVQETFQNNASVANVIEEEFNSLDKEIVNEVKDGSIEDVLTPDEGEFSEIDEMAEDFDNAVYDSKLADRKELHLGNKWNKKTDLKKVLFSSKRTLKKAVVLKEILDRPLALRE